MQGGGEYENEKCGNERGEYGNGEHEGRRGGE